ncbi:hypothetical protein U9012_26835, partial [Escherichia coli]
MIWQPEFTDKILSRKPGAVQELLDSISRLREDVNTLTVAFSYLAFSIPREQMQSTLASIQF